MTQTHSHIFDEGNPLAEKKTQWAVILTAAMMVFEIVGGWYFNSMALLSDGWHMSSHALALGLSVFTYKAARWFADDPRFAFGTWKMEVLGGYSSAILLLGVAGLMAFQSIERLISPQPIHYDEAIGIAVIGLLVNLVCAALLHDNHSHGPSHGHHHDHDHQDHDHGHHHHHHHHDLNLRSAYVHVLSDAATSVLAIVALFGGKYWGFAWLDPAMGIAGAILVGVWAVGLLKETGRVLLDAEMDAPVVDGVREVIASCPGNAEITDLHVWRVGRGKYACILSIAVNSPAEPEEFRRQLSVHEELVHITVEVNQRNA